jgi:arginyl-tRNA synthetase
MPAAMPPSVYERHRQAFAAALATAASMSPEDVARQIKIAEPEHGDLAFAAFPLAKVQKKAPPAIAAGLASSLKVPGLEFAATGPYLNARFGASFAGEVIAEVCAAGSRYGSGDDGAGKAVVIDFSSPNIAKPIAFHHIRSTVIGHALANLYRARGWKVQGINYLGDWGKQFGLVAVGFEEYGDSARKNDMGHLVEVYVKANARAEQDAAFDARARDFFRRMEQKDPAALALWQELRETSLRDFRRIYERLGIQFDSYEGESRYQDKMDAVIDEIARTVGTKQSEGALIVDIAYAEGEPPVLLRKNDGSTLYATRDFAAAIDRYERFHFTRSLYVVATDQSLHFRQLFRVLEKMGRAWAKDCIHVNFGRVQGMSTRRGNLVLLADVLDEARNRALDKVRENQQAGRIQTSDPERLAEQVGLGAVVFADLKNRRVSDYTFDWEEVLNFEGHTGPYLQYAHARACNILRKGGGAPERYDAALLTLPEEQALVRLLARLPVTVAEAVQENEPSFVARLLLDVAAAFSRWYTLGNQEREKRVLVDDQPALRAARTALTDATRATLCSGLDLLGISAPDTM